MANDHPIHVFWAGGDPPDWVFEGLRRIRRDHRGHANYTFWIQPRPGADRDGTPRLSPRMTQAVQYAREQGWTVREIRDNAAATAAVMQRRAQETGVPNPYTERTLHDVISLNLYGRTEISVKDLGVKMALATEGGYTLDLTTRKAAWRDLKPGEFPRRILGDKPLEPGPLGVKMPRFPQGRIRHSVGHPTHHPFGPENPGFVSAPHFDNFVMWAQPPTAPGRLTAGQRFFADTVTQFVRYHDNAINQGVAEGRVEKRHPHDPSRLALRSAAQDSMVAKWLNPDNPMQPNYIGYVSIRSLTETALQHYGVVPPGALPSRREIPQRTLEGLTWEVRREPTMAVVNGQVAKEAMGSWRPGAAADRPAKVTPLNVADLPTFDPAQQQGRITYPDASWSTRSSPTRPAPADPFGNAPPRRRSADDLPPGPPPPPAPGWQVQPPQTFRRVLPVENPVRGGRRR